MNGKFAVCVILILFSLSMNMLHTTVTTEIAEASNDYPVHDLDTGLNYSAIQEAIDAPQTLEGHTIQIGAGEYNELLNVSKGVTLIGEDPETTIVRVPSDYVRVSVSHVNIVNLTVAPDWALAIWASYCTISHCIIQGKGIYIGRVGDINSLHYIKIEDCTIKGCPNGILSNCQSDYVSIIGNEISDSSLVGVKLWHSGHVNMSKNTLLNDTRALEIGTSCFLNDITENIFRNNPEALRIFDSNNNTFYLNEFHNNGIRIWNYSYSIYTYFDNGALGNYWDEYNGTDGNGDGIGDIPFIVGGAHGFQDNYPLMYPPSTPHITGDLNNDRTVDILDIVIVASQFGRPPPPITDFRADINEDGVVDIIDIVTVAGHFGEKSH